MTQGVKWVPNIVHRYPKIFLSWMAIANIYRRHVTFCMEEGTVCEGCQAFFPHRALTRHKFHDGRTAPQCIPCDQFMGLVLQGLDHQPV